MNKLQRYRLQRELCLSNAAKAPYPELRELWQTVERGYAYLIELELHQPNGPEPAKPKSQDAAERPGSMSGF